MGRRRPRHPGRVAEVGHPRPAADRPRRPRHRRDLQRPDLPQIPRRSARGARWSRGGCAKGRSRRRRSRRTRSTCSPSTWSSMAALDEWQVDDVEQVVTATQSFHDLSRRAARERPRHARRPLPRPIASPSCARGSSGTASRGRSTAAKARAQPGRHQRRHDPRPRPLRASTCPTAGGVGELDEEMVYEARPRPGLPARREQLADRGKSPRDRVIVTARPRRPRRGAVSGRGDGNRPPGRARQGDRRLRPRGGLPRAPPSWPRSTTSTNAPPTTLVTYLREQQDATPGRPLRPDDRGRALPRRDRRLAPLHPLALRWPRPRPPGASPLAGKIRNERDLEADAIWSDDGIVIHLPDGPTSRRPADLVLVKPG